MTTIESKKSSTNATTTTGDGKAPSSIYHEVLLLIHATSAKDRSSIPRQITRDIRSRWNRLSINTRRFIGICMLPLLVCYLMVDIIDYAFPIYGLIRETSTNESSFSLRVVRTNEFVVVINTYQRPQQLQDAVRHNAETCGPSIGILTVYIVWAEEGVTPPTPERFVRG